MGFGMGPAALLQRSDVRAELELLDDQVEQLAELQETMQTRVRDRMREMGSRLRERGPEGAPDPRGGGLQGEFREFFEQINREQREQLAKILVPHQLKRLGQLEMQMRLRGGAMALLRGEVAEQLNITDQQREQLRAKAEEVERETRRKIAEIRRQAQEELISQLTPEQQAKIRELVGDPFEFQTEGPPGPAGGPRGARPPRQNRPD
jgi:hypothetical protein